ncbi:MAG: glycosyltransferase family 4 protein [Bacteroidales bacterium]|nr:glycosyltransferase family 4 protein [Bacteroidales bacterium]
MNILLISTIYPTPGPDNHGTKVCHFFAQEWMKMGHNVRVVHYQAVYPRPFYWAAKLMRNFLAAKTGAVIYTKRDDKTLQYEMDGVPVAKIPLYKPIPHGKFSSKGVRKSIAEIIKINEDANFKPDVIVGHFVNPQYEVLSALKRHYSGVKTALVYHLPAEIQMAKDVYGNRYEGMLADIDVLGFRNEPLLKDFKKVHDIEKPSFICYSGIPEHYITEKNSHTFEGNLREFIYVGEMIERKYPAQILDALKIAYPKGDFHITYIGSGQQISVIERKMREFELPRQVSVLGRIPRDEIKANYDAAQCMIMISKGEAYGLVYLEAMARGCITIASRDEGMDGVIKDGVNGFLCKAGDYEELASIIKHINALSCEERMAISNKAIETAKWLTDANAAQMYIDDIMKA